jgi:hypothetical protein
VSIPRNGIGKPVPIPPPAEVEVASFTFLDSKTEIVNFPKILLSLKLNNDIIFN